MAVTFLVKTLGCKVNQYDSQAISELLARRGFSEASQDVRPDCCIINTCTVTLESARKSRNLIRKLHRLYPKAKIIVTGCYVEDEDDRLQVLNIDGVSHILRRSELGRLPFILQPGLFVKTGEAGTGYPMPLISRFSGHHRAFLKVQDGCLQNCSYCKVRLVRGKFESRPQEHIFKEVQTLADNGYKEIVLTGIQLGAYGRDWGKTNALVELIRVLVGINNLERIRLSSIEPVDVTDELVDMISNESKLCPHLHIPLQSGDDFILCAMRRPYNREQYRQLIKRLYQDITNFSLTTDVMIGFPGEGEDQLKHTISLLDEIKPLKVHVFPYSDRKPTLAAELHPKVTERDKRERVHRLLDQSMSWSIEHRSKAIGNLRKVLVEREISPNFWEGHSEDYILVRFEAEGDLIGVCVSVEITGNEAHFSEGKLVDEFVQPVEAQGLADVIR